MRQHSATLVTRTAGQGLTATTLSVPVLGGRHALGTWQGIHVSSTAPGRTPARSCCILRRSDG